MSSRIQLDALRADSPLGFLAAVGVLRLTTEELGLSAPRLGWPEGLGGPAVLTVDASVDVDGLADALFTLVEDCRAHDRLVPFLDGFPLNTRGSSGSDPMRSLSMEHGRDLAGQAWSEPLVGRWLHALVATGAPEGDALPLSQLLQAGPGTVWVERTIRGVLEAITTPTALVHALTNWRRVDSIGAYLDARADVSAARAQASRGTAAKYGEPGASWLAIMSLPTLATRTTEHGRVTVGWRRALRRTYFRYPVWSGALSLAGVEAIVDHPAIALATRQRNRADLAALGVVAVMESERLVAGKYNGPLAEPVNLVG